MHKFLIINDLNDINDIYIRHFSLDKGHFIAKSLAKMGHEVYFLTTNKDYEKYGIKYIFVDNITTEFLDSINYVVIIREPLIINIVNAIPAIKEKLSIPKQNRNNPKFIIKSDSPMWFTNKQFINNIHVIFNVKKTRDTIKKWVINHFDFICAQNEDFCQVATNAGVPRNSIIISNMGISNNHVDYHELDNPYDINHSYCVPNVSLLGANKALLPLYYVENPDKIAEFNTKKYIIVYTGRIKTDSGKILFNMKNIMELLGEEYELHIFPGSFIIPLSGKTDKHSGKNSNSLEILRNIIFKENKNIIVHFPYLHENKYKYLYFADCGIDFSDIRPNNVKPLAGHAKILEYCEIGLPVVCENNIHNLFLIENGKNGIILPYMTSDNEYAEAIKKIMTIPINREYCRNITVQNENWDKKTIELLEQLDQLLNYSHK